MHWLLKTFIILASLMFLFHGAFYFQECSELDKAVEVILPAAGFPSQQVAFSHWSYPKTHKAFQCQKQSRWVIRKLNIGKHIAYALMTEDSTDVQSEETTLPLFASILELSIFIRSKAPQTMVYIEGYTSGASVYANVPVLRVSPIGELPGWVKPYSAHDLPIDEFTMYTINHPILNIR